MQLNLAGETKIERPNSLFHDLAVRIDRIATRLMAIFVRNVYIAYVHDLLRMNELSFQVSSTKRHHARSPYRRSNPNPLTGFPSPTLSARSLNLRVLSLPLNRHIINLVSVLILRDLDVCGLVPLGVLGHVVDLLLDDGFRFSARSS